jgi:hypothetical protein
MVMVGPVVGTVVGGVVTMVVVGTVVGSVVGGGVGAVVGSGAGGVTNVSRVVIVGVSPAAATGAMSAADRAQRTTMTRRVAMNFFTGSPGKGTSGSCAINRMRFSRRPGRTPILFADILKRS